MHIIFDMYGVIIKESKGNFVPYVYKHFPKTNKKELVEYFNQANTGKITGNQFIEALGFENADEVTKDYIENHLTFDHEFTVFAEKHMNCFTYALLSNDVASWSDYITSYYNINRYIQFKVISGVVGYRKPDMEIFNILLHDTLWVPEECIFIDNSVKNLNTAKLLGIKTVLFKRDNEVFDGDIVYSFDELDKLINNKYNNFS